MLESACWRLLWSCDRTIVYFFFKKKTLWRPPPHITSDIPTLISFKMWVLVVDTYTEYTRNKLEKNTWSRGKANKSESQALRVECSNSTVCCECTKGLAIHCLHFQFYLFDAAGRKFSSFTTGGSNSPRKMKFPIIYIASFPLFFPPDLNKPIEGVVSPNR